jgi:hypothetical protein
LKVVGVIKQHGLVVVGETEGSEEGSGLRLLCLLLHVLLGSTALTSGFQAELKHKDNG